MLGKNGESMIMLEIISLGFSHNSERKEFVFNPFVIHNAIGRWIS